MLFTCIMKTSAYIQPVLWLPKNGEIIILNAYIPFMLFWWSWLFTDNAILVRTGVDSEHNKVRKYCLGEMIELWRCLMATQCLQHMLLESVLHNCCFKIQVSLCWNFFYWRSIIKTKLILSFRMRKKKTLTFFGIKMHFPPVIIIPLKTNLTK